MCLCRMLPKNRMTANGMRRIQFFDAFVAGWCIHNVFDVLIYWGNNTILNKELIFRSSFDAQQDGKIKIELKLIACAAREGKTIPRWKLHIGSEKVFIILQSNPGKRIYCMTPSQTLAQTPLNHFYVLSHYFLSAMMCSTRCVHGIRWIADLKQQIAVCGMGAHGRRVRTHQISIWHFKPSSHIAVPKY